MSERKLPLEQNCSGCGACSVVCPVAAIKMEYSSRGFRVPVINEEKCINCGLCTKTCPTQNPVYENRTEPVLRAFCADDATRRVSSSGGMFSALADYVLEKGGYVCGAAFDEEMQLKHRIIHTKEELPPLLGSKYVQSNSDGCYKQIKRLLDDGETVLFTGTPCQVAALYNVLKKKYDTLITVDLICHGTPSQLSLDKYVSEMSENGKKIKNIQFRSKRLGWACRGLIISYQDGTEYTGVVREENPDPYFTAFFKAMMSRKICSNCPFSTYPRQGDFTIGDLWNSDKLDPKSNDKKGTSFVFTNNEKADAIFEELTQRNCVYHSVIPVEDYDKLPNRVRSKQGEHPARTRFLTLLKDHSFGEAFRLAYYNKYEIGMPGVIGNDNIGSILTYYALYNTLTEMGYSVLPIERPKDSPFPVDERAGTFTKKWLPAYSQPVQYDTLFDMRKLNQICDQFVLGSDQLFLSSMAASRNHCYMLQWADDSKNKIGYSTSFGGPGARGTKEYYKELKYYLNRFNFLSCRENDGVNFANKELKLKQNVEWCIDPVFLCGKDKYMKLVNSVKEKHTGDYIGSYVLITRPPVVNLVLKTRDHFSTAEKKIPVEVLGTEGNIQKSPNLRRFKRYDPFPIERALEMIFRSKFFVTDSFHGMCFSIIFRKDFLVMPRDFHDRFHSLLDRLGLQDRIIKPDLSNLTEASFQPIDYDAVYEKLNAEVARCKGMLSDALTQNKENGYSDMDILMQYIEKQQNTIGGLQSQIEELQKMVQELQK